MKKISFLVTLVLLSLSVLYISLPQEAFALFELPFLSKTDYSMKVKDIRGQISSYIEIHPTITLKAEEKTEGKEEEAKEEDMEFETVENKDSVVTHEANVAGNSEEEFILGEINKYRAENGLTAVSMNSEVCNFAALRAGELGSNYSHDGFRDRINSNTLPYPSYTKVTENIAENYSYTEVVNGWRGSPGHAENMRADTPFVCVKKVGSHHAYEGWKP